MLWPYKIIIPRCIKSIQGNLAKPKTDATNVAAALFKLGDVWREADKATFFEFGLKFWGFIRHNDVLTGTDEIVSKAFSAFVKIDNDFIEIMKVFKLTIRLFVKGAWAVSDCLLINDRNGKVEIVPETIGMVSIRVNMWAAIRIELWLGVDLD